MYSREEVKKLKEEFWTRFGQFMSPVPSSDKERINWVNYRTGVKYLFFKMDATKKSVTIMIEITHPDEGIRSLMFAQFEELKALLHNALEENWEWYPETEDEYGKKIAQISISIQGVSVFNKDDWPQLISFLKPRLMALDEFWSTAKYAFDIFK